MPSIENTVSFHADMPIAWRPEEPADAATHDAWMDGNRLLLRACTLSDGLPRDRDTGADISTLERVEAKLDLLLYLLGGIQGIQRPLSRPAVMSARSLVWAEDSAPEPGARVWLSLFLSPRMPAPLRIPARINDIASGEGKLWVRADFDPFEPELQELLEKAVFRAHRREVHARQESV